MDSVRVEVHGPRDVDVALREWLTDVPELRGRVRQEPTGPGSQKLGVGTDLVVALVSNLVSGALVSALQVWLTVRANSRAGGDVTVTVTTEGGRSVSVTSRDPDTGVQALRDLLGLPPHPGPSTGGQTGSDTYGEVSGPDDADPLG